MDRETTILNECDQYKSLLIELNHTPEVAEQMSTGFFEGACWADAHPQWHMCADCLPDADSIRCLCSNGRNIYILLWEQGAWQQADFYGNPIAWMYLPSLPQTPNQQ